MSLLNLYKRAEYRRPTGRVRAFMLCFTEIGRISLAAFLLTLTVSAENVPGRYIVELSTPSVSDEVITATATPATRSLRGAMQWRTPAALSHRIRVEAEQDRFRSSLRDANATVLDSVSNVANAVFVSTDNPDALRSLPGVKRVVPVRSVHLMLDRAIGLHGIPDVWNRVGVSNAGTGVRIGIIDSGIDVSHPAFQDTSLVAPATYPRASTEADLAYTNGKVIVARSYVSLLPSRDPDRSVRDHVGHGTATAMVAAGLTNAGPLASITGVAPRAWLGNYKVFGTPGWNDTSTDDAIIKAIDDAVADGMDIINLSLGNDIAPRPEDDPEVQAIERAVRAGVIVVVAAGNNGSDVGTLASPATAPSAIAVGASTNDRTFGGTVKLAGLDPVLAIPGQGAPASGDLNSTLKFVGELDGTGLACSELPLESLAGAVALIARGECTFEVKLNNAKAAGATGAVVYAREEAPEPISMGTGTATLPSTMISFSASAAIRDALESGTDPAVTLTFTRAAFAVPGRQMATFSAAGPGTDLSIKPDLLAAGTNIYVATQKLDSSGAMWDSTGYVVENGTSFSAPMVAGAAALLKSARPGLTVAQYRSLLINSAQEMVLADGTVPGLHHTGAGLLDANGAMSLTATVSPASLSFGTGPTNTPATRTLTVTNISTSDETYSLEAGAPGCATAPVFTPASLSLAAGGSATVQVLLNPAAIEGKGCEGAIRIQGSGSGYAARVPWWYAVSSGTPAHMSLLSASSGGRRGRSLNGAVLFRVTDASGVPLSAVLPEAKPIEGDPTNLAIRSLDSDSPGLFALDLRLGPVAGDNVVEITVGTATLRIAIPGM